MKTNSLPSMSITNVVNLLSMSYINLILNKKSPAIMPSVMLWGAPGLGKSQAVRQIAREIEEKTEKKVNVTDVRLLLFNPIDLRGIPTSNADKTLAIWLKPQIFDMDPSEKVVNILFLDEISAAPPSVQAAAYQITLDRVVGEHRLPDNCIVICAGNRVTDKSVAYKMPKALANRLLHLEVKSEFESWRKWAAKASINPKVIGFLSFRQDLLLVENSSEDNLAYATPRTWEMVSNVLNNVSDNISEVYSLISGLVGSGVALEFNAWCKTHFELPNVENIFKGKQEKLPSNPDILYALISSMMSFAKEHKDNMTYIENSIRYACQMPPDYAVVLLQGYQTLEKGYLKKLLKIPSYLKWMQVYGKLLNGIK